VSHMQHMIQTGRTGSCTFGCCAMTWWGLCVMQRRLSGSLEAWQGSKASRCGHALAAILYRDVRHFGLLQSAKLDLLYLHNVTALWLPAVLLRSRLCSAGYKQVLLGAVTACCRLTAV
jgi:hypothetical protein